MSRRNRIIDLLKSSERALTAREISGDLRIPEPTVSRDIVHIARSLRTRGMVLLVKPAKCFGCGFVFEPSKIGPPSRCPSCRTTRISPPSFTIRPSGEGSSRENEGWR